MTHDFMLSRSTTNEFNLFSRQGKDWWDLRQKVNPVMMQPRATKVYVPKIDEISLDFVQKIDSLKDASNRVSDDFLPLLRKWALESVSYISMDIRMGLLGEREDPVATKFMKTLDGFFDFSYQLDILPSLWKYYKTPTFKRAMKNNDEMVE